MRVNTRGSNGSKNRSNSREKKNKAFIADNLTWELKYGNGSQTRKHNVKANLEYDQIARYGKGFSKIN